MTNLEIAQQAVLRDIRDVATDAGLLPDDYESVGKYKAKLTQSGVARLTKSEPGKLILVSAVNPTPPGEGKTTVTVGLTQGLQQIGMRAISATREPALGPIFGVKGGACGGGYSQVLPMEDINLFFNGDFPAIAAAHNLLSAILDSHIHFGNALEIDPRENVWPRTMDMNDRALREIVIGLGSGNGMVREDGFIITPASEVMAIFCLATSLSDLKERLGSIVVARNMNKEPIYARDLKAHGAMTAVLASAIRPNLVQTIEGGPAFIHGGPFGNIAHGCSSIVGTQCALGLADYTVTEAGFGSDLGGEKFMDILCPRLGRGPDAIVLVATVRALVHHGGGDYKRPDHTREQLSLGFANLGRHIRHLQSYGPPVVVGINQRVEDSRSDHDFLISKCAEFGVPAVTCDPWGGGGPGCTELARKVVELSAQPSHFTPLYSSEETAEQKLLAIVRKAHGGAGVELSETAKKNLQWLEKHGFGSLPICVAKTQYSLSDDPSRLNAPEDFTLHVREIKLSAGAGFLVAISGEIMLMPGLGKTPAAFVIDVDDDGKITGLV